MSVNARLVLLDIPFHPFESCGNGTGVGIVPGAAALIQNETPPPPAEREGNGAQDLLVASLRRHYPNQVEGFSRRLESQPAQASTPSVVVKESLARSKSSCQLSVEQSTKQCLHDVSALVTADGSNYRPVGITSIVVDSGSRP